ncbi:prolyl oligopeptidase [Lutibacter oricola]|uniref:prolyl oligopeptidase n=1 Tax=Lutibacter oricola TaxID=762486 RepID=A0A1H2XSA3_9FLAO|nr:prolyl oligopeptidase family serine peptidase [Lutibacter oricola]SDW95706.1 prolyl oligopeptidase [Lutibacter oricola]
MNISKIIAISLFILSVNNVNSQIVYPKTIKQPTKQAYHNVEIVDDYLWLEKINSIEVKDWVKLQNKVSEKYLNKISRRNGSFNQMNSFMYYDMDFDEKEIELIKENKTYYKLMYPGVNSELCIYYKKGIKGSFEKLISPSSISRKDHINFTSLAPSKDDRFLAYKYNRNGSDWGEVKIVQLKNRRYFKETLKHIVSPEIYWFGQGFFYKKYKYTSEFGKREFPSIQYHLLDTEQSEDLIVKNTNNENEGLNLYGTPNQNLFIIKKSNRFDKKFSFYYLDPKGSNTDFKPLFKDIKYNLDIVRFKSDTVYALAKIKDKKYIISFPLDQPKKWKLITPIYKGAVFSEFEFLEDKMVISYQSNKSSIIAVVDYSGKVLGEVVTPEGLSIDGMKFAEETNEFYFKLTSYTVPPVLCQLDLENYKFDYLGKVEVSFDAKNYKFLRKNFTSHDGTQVPMFIVYKDSLSKNSNTPFLLETYGGYGRIAKPTYNPGVIHFIENGGAFAYVHVRGGGEFGEKWKEAGRKMNKVNAILDFTSAAEYLIEEGYTKPRKIAITGTSHGGLIIASAIIKKPELFGAAVINVGVLDMLRFENSSVGSVYTNINEFGSIKIEEEFKNLLSYSPYHNIDSKINYPSILISTGSDDNRVPPYYSYKFAAKLQENILQTNPVLLWSQSNTGHYGANKANSRIKENAFIYGFLMNELTKED